MPVARSDAPQQASPPSAPATADASAQQCAPPAVEPAQTSAAQPPAPSPQLPSRTNHSSPASHDAAAPSPTPHTTTTNQETNQSSRRPPFEANTGVITLYNLIVLITSLIVLIKFRIKDPPKLKHWLIVFVCLSSLRNIARYVLRRLAWRAMRIPRIVCHVLDTVIYIAYISWLFVAVTYLVEYKHEPNDRSSPPYIYIASITTLELSFFFLLFLFASIIFFCAASPIRRRPSPGASVEDLSKLSSFKYVSPQQDLENPSSEGTNMCSICLGDFAEEELLRELPCSSGKHVFHAECVDEWLMRRISCPICREDPLQSLREQSQLQTSQQVVTANVATPRRNRFAISTVFSRNRPVEQESNTEHAVISMDSP